MPLNSVVLVGRLTNNPEARATGSGLLVSTFSIAVNEFFKGEKTVSFFNIETFGTTAEMIRDKTQKGTLIAIEGQLKQERWHANSGESRSKVVIRAQKIQILDNFK